MKNGVPRSIRSAIGLALVSAIGFASAASAAQYEATFELDDFDASIVESEDGWSFEWKRAWIDTEPGSPGVPRLVIRAAVPDDEMVYTVELVPVRERVLGPGAVVVPAQDVQAPGARVARDAEAYGTTEWLPSIEIPVRTTGFAEGHRIVSLVVSPVRYKPDTGELRIAEEFRVRVQSGPATSGDTGLRKLRDRSTTAERRAKIEARVDWVINHAPAWGRALPSSDSGVFRASELPSLDGSAVDMVIVAPAAFEDAYQKLADWRTKTGTRTVVRTLEWVIDNYEAEDVAGRVRSFFRDAYVHWDIEYALIGGDHEFIPLRRARTKYRNFPDGVDTATDYYYACLDGGWNGDGDHHIGEGNHSTLGPGDDADIEYDLFVGRLPASSVSGADLITNKVMWYEGSDPARFDPTYQETMSFWAEVLFTFNGGHWEGDCADASFDGARIANRVYDDFMPENFQNNVNMVYEASQCPDNNGRGFTPIAESKQSVINDYNTGRHHVIHIGHGFRTIMAVGAADQKLTNPDADAMMNGDRLSVMYAINCNSGAVDFDCIGEHFLFNNRVNGNGGAVGLVAATDLDYPSTSQAHLNDYFSSILSGQQTHIGPAFFTPMTDNYIGLAANDNVFRWTLFGLVLLADPVMNLWSALPSAFDVQADNFYSPGFTDYQVSVFESGTSEGVAGATVTVYKEDEVYLTQVTDATGVVNFDFMPESEGTFWVGVRKANFIPAVIEGTVDIADFVPYVTLDSTEIDDSAGNNDLMADRGETVDLSFVLENVAATSATNVTLTATTSSSDATITQGAATVADIPGQSQRTSTPITVDVSTTLDGTKSYVDVPIELEVLADGSSWTLEYTLVARNPIIEHISLDVTEVVGNGDAVFDAGESWNLVTGALNRGDGRLLGGEVEIAAVGGTVNVTTATSPIDPAPGSTGNSAFLGFDVAVSGPVELDLTYRDAAGTLFTQRIDLDPPDAPADVWTQGGAGSVTVRWTPSESTDLMGYNLYREDTARGGFVRVNAEPIQAGVFANIGLPALSSFRFQVTTLDESGNESAPSELTVGATSPPNTSGFPMLLAGSGNRSSATVVDLDQDGLTTEMVFGSTYLYVVRGDGTEYVDGDDTEFTLGIFSTEGHIINVENAFWGKPAVADIDNDGVNEIVAAHFTSGNLYVWNADGSLQWGGASHNIGSFVWSSPSLANIDADPELEIVLWTGSDGGDFKGSIIAFNHDGTEVVDGDSNPATNGIFWKSSRGQTGYNYSSVAIWDIDGDEIVEIVANERYATDGSIHALELVGSTVIEDWEYIPPGGVAGHQFTSSPALADVGGDGLYEIFSISKKGLHGIDFGGNAMPGYPKTYTESPVTDFNDFLPSPMIGDINGDGELDVVHGWAEGNVYAYDAATGDPLPGWPVTIDIAGQTADKGFINGSIADVDGDLAPEVVMATAGGEVYAFDGDGSLLGGFPFNYGGSILGGVAISDSDRNGSVDMFFFGGSSVAMSLAMSGVPFTYDRAAWPQWRHDPRNSGVYASGLGTTPIDLGTVQVASTAPGEVHVRWQAPGSYREFRIERASAGEPRHQIGTVSHTDSDGLYSFVDREAPGGKFARYWIVGITTSGREEAGPFGVLVQSVVAQSGLQQNAPNPFVPRTSIGYDVGGDLASDASTDVRLQIYDVQGRLVRDLVNTPQAPGNYQVQWDGTDDAGRRLAPGVYIYRLRVGEKLFSRKLVMNR